MGVSSGSNFKQRTRHREERSDDPSPLAAQAPQGWESAEAPCAKAEAIHRATSGQMDCFAALAMTGETYVLVPAACIRPGFAIFGVPLSDRGSRESRAPTAPVASYAKVRSIRA